jgi:serine/threonine-protein kinase
MSERDPWVGRVLGDRYRLDFLLARGGMGRVYQATELAGRRLVALKLLEPIPGESRGRVRRFLREARTAAMVEHPNIVSIYETGEDESTGALFIVQELLRGRDLRHELEARPDGRLPAEETVALLLPVAEALEAAHALGIVHRDVTPSNIFIAEQLGGSVPKLIDFGLSKLLPRRRPDAESAPRRGPMGTFAFMAPEQALGVIELDGRVDVWSFGAVLYRCVTGTVPYIAPDLASLARTLSNDRPVPVDERADVPTELATIIHRAIDPDRERRSTMRELVHALRETELYARSRETAYAGPPSSMFRSSLDVGGVARAAREAEERRESQVDLDESPAGPPSFRASPVLRLPWAPLRPSPPSDAPSAGRRHALPNRMRFGTLAPLDPAARAALEEMAVRVRPFVKIRVMAGWPQLVDGLAEGDLDLAWMIPVAYARAARIGAARPMLTVERDGRRSQSVAIVTRVSREPPDVRSLAGLRAAWVDPWSAAGYLIPRRMMRSAGLEPDDELIGQSFVGSFGAVVRTIVAGGADVGAIHGRLVGDQVHAAELESEPALRVLGVSATPIPGEAICASSALSAEDAAEAVRRFIEITAEPRLLPYFRTLIGGDRLVAANRSRYAALEAVLEEDVARPGA